MKKLFGGLHMSWGRVLLFAVLTGIYTGAVMLIPQLENTSFQDIGISYEWWVLFAVILVVNCDKGWEAALKCFVFFLVSQPIVYLVEVVAGSLSFEMAMYYYRTIWFRMTILTLPGGLIAWLCKKQNLLGAVVLGLGNTIQAVLGVYYLSQAFRNFPYHLLSGLFCFGSMAVMSIYIQKTKKNCLVSLLLPVVLTLGLEIYCAFAGLEMF